MRNKSSIGPPSAASEPASNDNSLIHAPVEGCESIYHEDLLRPPALGGGGGQVVMVGHGASKRRTKLSDGARLAKFLPSRPLQE